MRKILWGVFCLFWAGFLLQYGCHRVPGEKDVLVLFDFEDESDLDRLSWECKVIYARDTRHVRGGRFSLRLEMYPSDYPGLKAAEFPNNWTGYASLKVDVYNPQERPVRLSYRIDDREDNPDYEDRANGSFLVQPGWTTLTLDLSELATSGARRPLNLEHIYGLYLFLCNPRIPVTLFLDNIRLTR